MMTTMFKLILVCLWFSVSSSVWGGNKLIQDLPSCEINKTELLDFDGDSKAEFLCLKLTGKKVKNFEGQGIYIVLSRTLATKQIAITYKNSVKDDAYFEEVDLLKYRNSRLKTKLHGYGLRIVYPEKSSVIFYWNAKLKKLDEFWESD
jgi:methionine-rich copper-binding protein CopC